MVFPACHVFPPISPIFPSFPSKELFFGKRSVLIGFSIFPVSGRVGWFWQLPTFFWGMQGIANILWIISWRTSLVSSCKFWCGLAATKNWGEILIWLAGSTQETWCWIYLRCRIRNASILKNKKQPKIVSHFCKANIAQDFLMISLCDSLQFCCE